MSKSNQQVICDNLPRSPIAIAYTEMLSVMSKWKSHFKCNELIKVPL